MLVPTALANNGLLYLVKIASKYCVRSFQIHNHSATDQSDPFFYLVFTGAWWQDRWQEDLLPRVSWCHVRWWTALSLNMVFVMDRMQLEQKSSNKPLLFFRQGRSFLPITPLEVTLMLPILVLTSSSRMMESLVRNPSWGLQEGWVFRTAVQPISQNNTKIPIPDPKAQGGDPLIHSGEVQHMVAELGSYKQADISSSPLTADNSRVEESPASLKEFSSIAQTVHRG